MAFAPREWINLPSRLCILMVGFAWRAGKMLTEGHYWGDIIVTAEHFQDKRRARALGYAEVPTRTPHHASHALHSLHASHDGLRYTRYTRYMCYTRYTRYMR